MNKLYLNDIIVGKAQLEYECRISKLKLDYCHLQQAISENSITKGIEQQFTLEVKALRNFFKNNPDLAAKVSSFFIVPTVELPKEQRIIHRIWLGGLLPFNVDKAICQWFSAINESAAGGKNPFRQILWIWQKKQIEADTRFRSRSAEDPCQVGEITTDCGIIQVNALYKLLSHYPGCNDEFICQLHQHHYYATLSDYFRLLILLCYGGMYMDADTVPYRPVSWFLFKPELPAMKHFLPESQRVARLSWLNLFLDETGLIVAIKGDPALADIFTRLNEAYARLDNRVLPKNIRRERHIFDLFYAIWRDHWGKTFISHDDFCQHYAVFYQGQKEAVLCGIRGMRLLEDIISGEYRPLTTNEKRSYQRAVRQLETVNWTLSDPLKLEEYCEVYSVMEVPRIAYALQMRSDVEHYHYYGVLSADPLLDRINTLFGRYLLESNARRIAQGHFWWPVGHVDATDCSPEKERHDVIHFAPGCGSSDEDRNSMARLIFTTSYLEYCSAANPRQMDIISLQRAQNIDPFLDVITLVLKPDSCFAGFFTAALMARFKLITTEYLYREEMRALDRDYDLFVEKNSRNDDYFIASLVLEATARGKKYFPLIMAHIERQAIKEGATRLTLCVWERGRAFTLYKRWGFRQSDSSDRWLPYFADRLHFLEKEIAGSRN